MVVGGWEGRKGGEREEARYSREGQPPQDALTWTMGMPAPTLHRLVLLLVLLAPFPPPTQARVSRPGSLYPLYWSASSPQLAPASNHQATLQPPHQWQWWNVIPPTLPSSSGPWNSLVQPQSSLPAHGPVRTGEDGFVSKNQVLEDDTPRLYGNLVNRIPFPSLSRKPLIRRFRPSRWRSSEKKKVLKILQSNHISKNRPPNSRRQNSLHSHTAQKEEAKKKVTAGHGGRPASSDKDSSDHRHLHPHDSDSKDLDITLTVPSTVLQPLLTSLPLTKRHIDTKTSAIPDVEIVGLRIKDADDVNTTVVLSLRDHHTHEEQDIKKGWKKGENKEKELVEHEDTEEEEGGDKRRPLSRNKRGTRRRMSYGMNAMIRARMLAHRLSISYRHVQPCSYKDRYYCMNGGTCVFVGALDIKTCRCPIGYTGVRCELIDQEYILSLLTDSIIFS